MPAKPLLDVLQEEPGALVVLCSLRVRQVERELFKVPDDGLAHLLVRGISRPQVRWNSAGNAWDAAEGRRTKFLVFGHQKARPSSQVLKETVELPMQFVVPRDLPVGLFDVLHHIDDFAQDPVEGGDCIVWSWRIGRRTGLFPRIAEVLASRAIRSTLSGFTSACSVFCSRATYPRRSGRPSSWQLGVRRTFGPSVVVPCGRTS